MAHRALRQVDRHLSEAPVGDRLRSRGIAEQEQRADEKNCEGRGAIGASPCLIQRRHSPHYTSERRIPRLGDEAGAGCPLR